LGEFSPIGSLFTLGSFVKITEVAPIIALLFNGKIYVLIISKTELGDILGDFFTNASGHPERITSHVFNYILKLLR
jgi:hypothetical protein